MKKDKVQTGKGRRDQILDTTIDVLVYEGHASVTMRAIADRVGIRLSTLQYYFPSKHELLKSAIEKCIGSVVAHMDEMAVKSKISPQQLLNRIFKMHLSTSCDPFISKFFFALWALASHDKGVEKLLNEIYDRDCKRYAKFIRRANPKLSAKAADIKATLILAQLEGLVLMVTPGRMRAGSSRMIERELNRIIERTVFDK
jgi:AcrR family transcriptional regulator